MAVGEDTVSFDGSFMPRVLSKVAASFASSMANVCILERKSRIVSARCFRTRMASRVAAEISRVVWPFLMSLI